MAIEKLQTQYKTQDTFSSSLGVELWGKFQEWKRARVKVEERWLDDLRRYKGQYTPDQLKLMDPLNSRVFMRIPRLKTEIFTRLMLTRMLGMSGKNWTISPSPDPEISDQDRKMLLESLMRQGGGQPPAPEVVEEAIRQLCDKRARNMETEIMDQLSGDRPERSSRYTEILRKTVRSSNLFGTGIMKGPMVEERSSIRYVVRSKVDPMTGVPTPPAWEQEKKTRYVPYLEHVPVWDFYPEPSCTSMLDCRGAMQRHIQSSEELRGWAAREDFIGEAILSVLEAYPHGTADVYENFETQLRGMGDRSNSLIRPEREKRYEVVEFWGVIDGQKLVDSGMGPMLKGADGEPLDLRGDVFAQVWMMGFTVIKIALSHLKTRKIPYYVTYFDKDESSFWGEGIPSMSADPVDMLNALIRASLDNAAITSGPQFELNMDLLDMPNNEDALAIYPRKQWFRTGTGQEAMAPAVKALTFPSTIQEMLPLIALAERFCDEISGVPATDMGDVGAGNVGRTATEASIRNQRSNTTVAEQTMRYDDDITGPLIGEFYQWNMQFNQREDIKGDFEVVVKGADGIQAREMKAQHHLQFLQVTQQNPEAAAVVKTSDLVRLVAENMEIDPDVIRDDSEAIQFRQQMMQQQAEAQAQAIMPKIQQTLQGLQQSVQALQSQIAEINRKAEDGMSAAQIKAESAHEKVQADLAVANRTLDIKEQDAAGKLLVKHQANQNSKESRMVEIGLAGQELALSREQLARGQGAGNGGTKN